MPGVVEVPSSTMDRERTNIIDVAYVRSTGDIRDYTQDQGALKERGDFVNAVASAVARMPYVNELQFKDATIERHCRHHGVPRSIDTAEERMYDRVLKNMRNMRRYAFPPGIINPSTTRSLECQSPFEASGRRSVMSRSASPLILVKGLYGGQPDADHVLLGHAKRAMHFAYLLGRTDSFE